MDISRYILTLRKWWWLIVLAIALSGGASYWSSSHSPRIYKTTTTIIVGQILESTNPASGDFFTSQQLAQSYAQAARRQPVLQAAIDALGLDMKWQSLALNVNATALAGTQLMQISVVDTDPQRAKIIADEIAEQLILQSPTTQDREHEQRQQFVGQQIEALENQISDAQERIGNLEKRMTLESSARVLLEIQTEIGIRQQNLTNWQANYAKLLDFYKGSRINYLSIIEAAPTPTNPIAPDVWRDFIVAVSFGFMMAAGAALLMEYLDDTLRTEEDVKRVVAEPTLGSIAYIDDLATEGEGLISIGKPHSTWAEAYRVVCTNILFEHVDLPSIVLLVTSPTTKEGKSVTAANLAVTFAQMGRQTILVDLDLRHPVLHSIFKIANNTGLTSFILDEQKSTRSASAKFEESLRTGEQTTNTTNANMSEALEAYLIATDIPDLRILPSGQTAANPAQLLNSAKMHQLLETLKKMADVVVLDTPPVLPAADTAILAAKGVGVVLVGEAGKTRSQTARLAMQALHRAHARVLGVVLNKVPRRDIPYYGYGYSPDQIKPTANPLIAYGSKLWSQIIQLVQRSKLWSQIIQLVQRSKLWLQIIQR